MAALASKICITIRETTPEKISQSLSRITGIAGFLELRLDYLESPHFPPALLGEWKKRAGIPIIATFRRKPNGGEFRGSVQEQMEMVRLILEGEPDYLDLEIETVEEHLNGDLRRLQGGSTRLIVSYHNFQETPEDLGKIYDRLCRVIPDVVKVATLAKCFSDNFKFKRLIAQSAADQRPIIAVAMGELGGVTRLLAPSWGSLLTYASIEKGKESAPGQFQAEELQELYSTDLIQSDTRYYGVLGYPLGHSLSPHIHNAAFRQLGLNCRYFPLPVRELQDFASSLDYFSGLSITIPYKQAITQFAQKVDDSVHEAGAANTLVQQNGRWVAYNTDLDGIELALQNPFRAGVSTAVLLGTGGAARAAAAFLKRKGCQVVVLGRDLQKVKAFAQDYGFDSDLLSGISHHAADLLINTTPVGMAPLIEHSPLPADTLQFKYVFDMVYNPLETRLLKLAKDQGCQTISGLEMFIGQAARQFELWTTTPAPVALMRETALQHLQRVH